MNKPKLIERPNCQLGYLKRAQEMKLLAKPHTKRGGVTLSWIYEHVIKPRYGTSYRTFLRAYHTDTSMLERRENERDERERRKLQETYGLTQLTK